MSPLVDRSDSHILPTLINFYERYHAMVQEFPTQWPEEPGIEASKYTVHLPGGDICMASPAVHSTLKLLCKSNEKTGPAREALVKVRRARNSKTSDFRSGSPRLASAPRSRKTGRQWICFRSPFVPVCSARRTSGSRGSPFRESPGWQQSSSSPPSV